MRIKLYKIRLFAMNGTAERHVGRDPDDDPTLLDDLVDHDHIDDHDHNSLLPSYTTSYSIKYCSYYSVVQCTKYMDTKSF